MIKAAKNGVPTTIARIGQLAGSRRNGAWNITDWFPLIIKAATSLRVLPALDVDMSVTWIPVDVAAQTVSLYPLLISYPSVLSRCQILELALLPSVELQQQQVFHVAHPYPTTWNVVITEVKRLLDSNGRSVELISFESWIQRLRDLSKYPETVHQAPVIKLLPFFEERILAQKQDSSFKEALGFARVELIATTERSQKLSNVNPITKLDVANWLDYWQLH